MDEMKITRIEKSIIYSSAKKVLMYLDEGGKIDFDIDEVVKIHVRRIINIINDIDKREGTSGDET